MAEMITKEWVQGLPDKAKIQGLVYVRTYNEMPKKSGDGTYLIGTADGLGAMTFKVWQGETFDTMKEFDHVGKVCEIWGSINEFNGDKSIVIDKINRFPSAHLQPLDFMERKYDAKVLWDGLLKTLNDKCSPDAMSVFLTVMEPIRERFMLEFAAINHHDACVNGLLAHTYRVVKLAQIMKFYPEIEKAVSADALFVGAAIHDIGKILEYNNGAMSEDGKYVNHLTLGLTLIIPHKEYIESVKDAAFYDTLVSIIQQHHGEYGERPKTLAAYLVHKLDSLEAELTDVSELVSKSQTDIIKKDEFVLRY